jgi:Cu-processing system ATP-binding protein
MNASIEAVGSPIVEARCLTKCFGKLRVLDGLDLTVPRGQITAIIGPNGSGKTTFNRSILGLVRPDSGYLSFDGVPTNGDPAYRARIGYMPQAARFPENLCADEVIRLVTEIRGTAADRDEELLATFDLGAAMRTPVRLLSGGMRQRINATLAFLFRPALLILDEPTAGLDPVSSSALKDKILRERDAGRTFILTSHVLSELEELADRVAFLLDGKVRFCGAQSELRALTDESTLERAIAHLMTGSVKLGSAA